MVVVGAGPAGSEAAFRLAKLGYDTLIVEKEAGLREKACAGGVERVVLDEFGRPPKSVIERKISNLLVVSRGLYHVNFSIGRSLLTVMRSKYDSWLQRRAVEQGATLFINTKVKQVSLKDYPTITVNSGTKLRTRFLVDASGAYSIVRRSHGEYWSSNDIAVGVQYQIDLSSQKIDDRIGDCCELYFDSTSAPDGYFWIFPKRDIVAVGVCGAALRLWRERINLREKLDTFIRKHPFAAQKLSEGVIRFRQSAILPVRLCENLVYPNTVIIGDAGGFIDPLFKGGIYAAHKSAEIASKYGNAFLETGDPDQLLGYEAEKTARFHQVNESNRLVLNVLNSDELIDRLIEKATPYGITSLNNFMGVLRILSAMESTRSESEA